QSAIEALLYEQGEAADGDVLVLAGEHVGAIVGARAPAEDTFRHDPDAVDAERVDLAVLAISQVEIDAGDATETRLGTGRCLPDAAIGVRARIDPGGSARCAYRDVESALVDGEAREIDGAVVLHRPDAECGDVARRGLWRGPGVRWVHDQKRASPLAK